MLMEPTCRPPLTTADSLTSPQNSISQEDYSSVWMEGDSDTEEREKDAAGGTFLAGEAPMAEEEDLLESEWSMKELHSLLSSDNPDVNVQQTCADSERERRNDSEGNIDTCHLLAKKSKELLRFPSTDRDLRKGRGERLTSEITKEEITDCKMSSKDTGSPQSVAKHSTNLKTTSCGQVRLIKPCSPNGVDSCKRTYVSASENRYTEAYPQKCMTMGNKVMSLAESENPASEARGGSVKHNVDSNPLDFSLALEQWVQLDSASSKPPTPSVSRSTSRSLITVPSPAVSSTVTQQLPTSVVKQDDQQGEVLLHHLSVLKQKQEVQQMLEGSPPLATVSQEPANQGARCHGSSFVVVREPSTGTGGRGAGEREEKQGGQTGGEKQQKVTRLYKSEIQKCWERVRRDREQDSSGPEVGGQTKHSPRDSRVLRMDWEGGEDNQSDSGVSIDFSPSSTMDLNSTSDEVPNETPIEREIRQAAEREQSLRRSRGLTKTQEFVEIPLRKPILSQQLPPKLGKNQRKDRQFAGKKMQQEIEVEVHREQVLVQLGKVPGVYDKGTMPQLQERRQLFEAFQESQQSTPVLLSKRPSSSISDLSTLEVHGRDASAEEAIPECPQSADMLLENQTFTPSAPCGPTLTEGTQSQVIILESGDILRNSNAHQGQLLNPSHRAGPLTEEPRVTVEDAGGTVPGRLEESVEEADVDSAIPRENPFFKLRSSMSLRPEVEQDIREAWEREQELRKQRSSLYRAGAGGSLASSSETSSSKSQWNGVPSQPSSTISSARQSRKLDLVWPPPQVDPVGAGRTEATRSPRSARQKHPLLERWEAGMVNGYEEGQE